MVVINNVVVNSGGIRGSWIRGMRFCSRVAINKLGFGAVAREFRVFWRSRAI